MGHVPAFDRLEHSGVLPLDVLLELGPLDPPNPLGADLDRWQLARLEEGVDLGSADGELVGHVVDREEAGSGVHAAIFAGRAAHVQPVTPARAFVVRLPRPDPRPDAWLGLHP